jgi:uncharacterized membrane protein YgcG
MVFVFLLIPFWLAFRWRLWVKTSLTLFLIYLFGVGIFKLWLAFTQGGKKMVKKWRKNKWVMSSGGASGWRGSGGGGSWRSSSSGSSFSGGGGSFSGGGASGSW